MVLFHTTTKPHHLRHHLNNHFRTFVDAKIKWVRDPDLDNAVQKEKNLKPLLSLKTLIVSQPSKTLPISTASLQKPHLNLPIPATKFIQKYHPVFQIFKPFKPLSLPHVRLTPRALSLHKQETQILNSSIHRQAAAERLAKLLMLIGGYPVLGVGFTGSLATTRPKLGDHRFHLSTRTSNRLWVSTVTLSKGLRTRDQEERVSSQFLLKAIANACKVQATFDLVLTESEVPDECEKQFDEDQELEQLISGQICFKIYPFLSDTHASSTERKIILSGSFNPLHDGHLKLLDIATSICGDGYPCFELSAINADKPPLAISQIKNRVKQFEKVGKSVIISNQPYFYKKAELFPGSAFVIGADTVARLINPKYYSGDYGNMLEILKGCKSTGCIFLVGGRNVDGIFKVLEDFDIPKELKDMFISIPVERFRMDISSTELRKSRGT